MRVSPRLTSKADNELIGRLLRTKYGNKLNKRTQLLGARAELIDRYVDRNYCRGNSRVHASTTPQKNTSNVLIFYSNYNLRTLAHLDAHTYVIRCPDNELLGPPDALTTRKRAG